MRKQKITDEQINRHLSEGMSQSAIARLYGIDQSGLSKRIKKMRETGTLQDIHKMDTVVRLSDHCSFRVMEVTQKEVTLKGIEKRETITVPLDRLSEKFKKKDYPRVSCYTVSELEKHEKKAVKKWRVIKNNRQQKNRKEIQNRQVKTG